MLDIALLAPSPDANPVMPERVACYGGKPDHPEDDRTSPDTHFAVMQSPGHLVQREIGRRPLDGEHDHGTQFIAADGTTLTIWRGSWWIRDSGGREIATPEAPDGMDGPIAHVVIVWPTPRLNLFAGSEANSAISKTPAGRVRPSSC